MPYRLPAALILTLSAVASAQLTMPDYSTRDTVRIIEALGLTMPEQKEILKILLDDFDRTHRQTVELLRSDIASLSDSTDVDRRHTAMLDRTEAFIRSKADMRRELESNLADILDEQQLAIWSDIARQLRRERQIPVGSLIDERIDLTRLVADTLDAAVQTPEFHTRLDRWELDIDEALQARNAINETASTSLRRLVGAGQLEEALQLRVKLLQVKQAVRDTNRLAAIELAALLPQSEAAALREAVQRAGDPQYLRLSQYERNAQRVLRHPDLDADTRAWVEAHTVAYRDVRAPTLAAFNKVRRDRDGYGDLAVLQRKLNRPVDLERWDEVYHRHLVTLTVLDREWVDAMCNYVGDEVCGDRQISPIPASADLSEASQAPGGVDPEMDKPRPPSGFDPFDQPEPPGQLKDPMAPSEPLPGSIDPTAPVPSPKPVEPMPEH